MGMSEEKYNTMRRIKDGAEYNLRGDKAVGIEIRKGPRYDNRKVVNCRSLPPLIREGLIDFERYPSDMTRYYRVRLTDEGEKLLKNIA
ncbi:hypothetical protein Pat9b_5028 (plasmid) [Pantoea sp. At-9b]|nr:hypothetical protein Pat9b_5028 [Pantoea sp. At-9b]